MWKIKNMIIFLNIDSYFTLDLKKGIVACSTCFFHMPIIHSYTVYTVLHFKPEKQQPELSASLLHLKLGTPFTFNDKFSKKMMILLTHFNVLHL